MPEHEESASDLVHLGPGLGSKVEHIKAESHHMRGQIAEELVQDTSRFSDPQVQLMKFHGIYQQENRDVRQTRKAAGEEKAYQFMVRTRIPGGRITAEQYLVHDDLADRYANGTLRITTRQGFQLHGALKGVLTPTIQAINEALLTTLAACGDVNRNVMACPVPFSDCSHTQIEEIAQRIAQHLTPRSRAYHEIWIDGEQVKIDEQPGEAETEPIYGPTYLPRKFKIGVAAPGDNCIDVYTQDIGLVATLKEDKLEGFTVLIGGGMGMTHNKAETFPRLATPLCFAPVDAVLPIVETIVKVQRDYGDRQNRKHARMKYVVEERGIVWFRNEVEQRLGYSLQDPRPLTWHHAQDHLGWHAQGDGRWYLGLFVENGRVKDDASVRMRTGLRHAIEQFHPNIRLTPQQNILLTDLAETQRAPLTALLAAYGIPLDPDEVGMRRFALACPALPTCGLALAEAERALPSVVRQIEADLQTLGMANEPLGIRMTGCPNGCARPYMGDIGFVGRTKDVYNIYVGGDMLNTRMNTLYAASVHVKDLAATLRPLLALWKDERLPRENFGDFCYRVGLENLQTQVPALVNVKGENSMPNYYPIMLDVRGRVAIVVGGDKVAAEKAASLSASGAQVTVLSPTFCPDLLEQAEARRVTLHRKAYESGDLAGAFVVVAVADDPELVRAIWAETQERGQLVNIVDVPANCSFILPSILRREQLTVAVSTEGASPGLARRIRQQLEAYFPLAYGPYLRLAALARSYLRNNGVSYERRDHFFEDFFTSDVLAQLIKGNAVQATTIIADLLQRFGIAVEARELEAGLKEEKEYGYRGA